MSAVLDLDLARIERALARRERYRYVQPRVLREGTGFRVLSPNCSRSIDEGGGEIEIARLEPLRDGWVLMARDHARCEWRVNATGPLPRLLRLLAADPSREFWL